MKWLSVSSRALPFAAVIVLVAAPTASAASTLYVDGASGTDSPTCGAATAPCKTIQQAVDNAAPGDTIQVAPGTYDGSVTVDRSLTLDGAQAGNVATASRAAATPATESVITGGILYVEAGGVTVDGFSFAFTGNQVTVDGSGATIENDVFSGYGNDAGTNDAIGIDGASDTTVTHDYFTSPSIDYGDFGGAVVQWYNGGCSGSVVSDNVFDDADASALADVYFYCDDQPVPAITVSGNRDTIGGSSSFVNFQHIGGAGAVLTVTDNTISMTPASGSSGLYFSSSESGVGRVEVTGNSLTGDPYRAVKLSTNARISGPVEITDNDFSHSGVGVYVGANSLSAGASLTLDRNDLSSETGDSLDPAAGVEVAPGAMVPAPITATGNDLSGSGTGVYVGANGLGPGGSVAATDNWWGCNGGPGAAGCSGVSGAVTSDPWLVLGVSASPSSLVAPGSSTVTADVTRDSAGADTSASGTIPDGTSIAFATDFGTLSASFAGTSGGKASVSLSSATPGTANVSATLDAQSVSTTVTFTAPPRPTSADQCKAGGWQSYRIFKNQGDCVSFVVTHGKNGPAR